jgi:hypothetical protein
MGIISVDFGLTDQLLVRYSIFVRNWRKKWEYNGTIRQLFIDLRRPMTRVRREILYSILTEFGIPMKLIRSVKMCLNETCNKVCIGNK